MQGCCTSFFPSPSSSSSSSRIFFFFLTKGGGGGGLETLGKSENGALTSSRKYGGGMSSHLSPPTSPFWFIHASV